MHIKQTDSEMQFIKIETGQGDGLAPETYWINLNEIAAIQIEPEADLSRGEVHIFVTYTQPLRDTTDFITEINFQDQYFLQQAIDRVMNTNLVLIKNGSSLHFVNPYAIVQVHFNEEAHTLLIFFKKGGVGTIDYVIDFVAQPEDLMVAYEQLNKSLL